MQVFSSKAARRRGIIAFIGVGVAFVGLYLALARFAPFVFDAVALREWIGQFGVWAPLVFMLIQTVQVVVAPVPGQALALVAGYLFGPLAGTVYSLTGVLIGSAIAFSLAKRFGRSFVKQLLHDDVMARFDGFLDTIGIPGLLAFLIVPGLPDDAICFLAGLTTWRLRTFMLAVAVGRLPAYVLTVYAGGELAGGRFRMALFIIAGVIAFSALGFYKQETIRDFVGRLKSRL